MPSETTPDPTLVDASLLRQGRSDQRQLLSLMMARVSDAYVRKPFFVDGQLDLVSVCRLLSDHGTTNALVRDGERIGMFTTTDLRDALLLGRPPGAVAVREFARFELAAIDSSAAVFEALLLMIRHRVHRVVVRDGAQIVGVLSQLDLMGFVSNHSHLIALSIEQATGIDELKAASHQVNDLVDLLHEGGTRVEVISGMVSELNVQLFARLWSLLAPPDLMANSCLLVMGSEGRGEQILKTDQDNALLLADGFEWGGLAELTERFTAALIEFGYPPCPGNIVVSNPLWRQPLSAFKDQISDWLRGSNADGPMNLSIFLDAAAVAGDATLLGRAKEHLNDMMAGSDVFLARFARAADQFAEPGWWSRLTGLLQHEEPLFDLKKLGTFPIVHGVRALALQRRIDALATTARLKALVAEGGLSAKLARDLTEALHFFMALKLKNNLRQRQAGERASNVVRLSDLGTLEGDQLKDALAIIRQFRQYLQHHFRLDSL
ncbi:MAG: DUF294 nucleotidyltransferase-like domain-containing protein [Burkholderiales bacterium]